MKLSELIQRYIDEHGISQRQLSDRCGLSSGYISLILKEVNPQTGKRMVPTLPVLHKLATGLGMTLDELLSVCEDMPIRLSEKVEMYEETEQPTGEGGLTRDEAILLALYRSLSEEERRFFLLQLRAVAQDQEDPGVPV